MSLRPTDLLDRAATLVAGLILTAIGAAAILWPTHLVHGFPARVSAGPVVRASGSGWWPWVLAGTGTLLVVVALAWLVAHVPVRTAPVLRINKTSGHGVIDLNLDAVAAAAATELTQHPNVLTAKGKALTDRGSPTVELTVTTAHPAGLAEVIAAIDTTCSHIADVTTGATVAARAVVQLGTHDSSRRNLE